MGDSRDYINTLAWVNECNGVLWLLLDDSAGANRH